jgi:hypothetical protein
VLAGRPTCAAPTGSTELIRQWCANAHDDCVSQTDGSVKELECAVQIDAFLYNAEAMQHRIDAKQQHDANCHQRFGN